MRFGRIRRRSGVLVATFATSLVAAGGLAHIPGGAAAEQPAAASAVEIIVDNDDGAPGYTENGTWTASATVGYGGSTTRYSGTPGSTATWTPVIEHPGSYEVAVWLPDPGTSATSQAHYIVDSASGSDEVVVDQLTGRGWHVLGTYEFGAGTDGTVTLRVTPSTGHPGHRADAVRFRPDEDPFSANAEIPIPPAASARQNRMNGGVFNGEGDGDTATVSPDGVATADAFSESVSDPAAQGLGALRIVDRDTASPDLAARTQTHFVDAMTGQLGDDDSLGVSARLRIVSFDNPDPFAGGASRAITMGFTLPYGVAYHSVSLGIVPDLDAGTLRLGINGVQTLERNGFAQVIEGVDFGEYHTYGLRKVGFDRLEILFDGEVMQTLDGDYVVTAPRRGDNTRNGLYFGATSGPGRSETMWDWVRWHRGPNGVPETPAITAARPSVHGGAVQLSFTPVRAAKTYTIEYGSGTQPGSGPVESITGVRDFVHAVDGLVDGTPYWFQVRGVDGDQQTAPSPVVVATPMDRSHVIDEGDVTMFFQPFESGVYEAYGTDRVVWGTPQKLDATGGGRAFSFDGWNADYTENADWREYVEAQSDYAQNQGVALGRVFNINAWTSYFAGRGAGDETPNKPFDRNAEDALGSQARADRLGIDYNHPLARNWFTALIDYYASFEAPIAGLHFDEVGSSFTGGMETLGSINKFTYFLNSHLSDAELLDLGIEDVFRYDYHADPKPELAPLWSRFRELSRDQLVLDLTQHVRDVVGHWVPISVTGIQFPGGEEQIQSIADFDSSDDHAGLQTIVSSGVVPLANFEKRHRDLQYHNVVGAVDSTFMAKNPDRNGAFKLVVAATYARGDFIAAPHHNYGGPGRTWVSDPADYSDIFTFIAGHDSLFDGYRDAVPGGASADPQDEVAAIARWNAADPDTRVVHVVNRSYDAAADAAVHKEDLTVRVAPAFVDADERIVSATMYRFDGQPLPVDVERVEIGRTAVHELTLPVLDTWAVVELEIAPADATHLPLQPYYLELPTTPGSLDVHWGYRGEVDSWVEWRTAGAADWTSTPVQHGQRFDATVDLSGLPGPAQVLVRVAASDADGRVVYSEPQSYDHQIDHIVDNDHGAPAYTETGTWAASALRGHDGSTTRFTRTVGASATWTATLDRAGDYEVAVWFPAEPNGTTEADYRITTADGVSEVVVDQRADGGTWRVLGTYPFAAGDGAAVTLAVDDANGHRTDAVRFRLVDPAETGAQR